LNDGCDCRGKPTRRCHDFRTFWKVERTQTQKDRTTPGIYKESMSLPEYI
jgi:hypothetical protein